ncbi:Dipeptidyl-peptidase 5 [Methylacidimicrobium cyclopophantes]|uniref:Dipeptidyl-peptidase 5 n=1 Tax=Methylacidimicrobium cyclopophantes TaxID=1041766 RepID=A0A5E6MGF0_9BACT|nr:biopolymer transporter Tol [Methylacidimicrobium cyclopophantes]VVM05149.1 Dipeptidyl-peptidase 5 [Methylacidimicrobium cyclopophantes]
MTGGRVAVALLPFGGPDGAKAHSIVSADLTRTLLIEVGSGKSERFEASATVGAGSLAGRIVDRHQKTPPVERTFTGDLRLIAHQFADAITQQVTGVSGFATSRVAFISQETGYKELYVMDIDGANVQRLTADRSISAHPRWSHNGALLVYTSYRSGYPDVYIVKLGKRTRSRVAFFPGINSGAAFSPDDLMLALTLSKDGNPEIYLMPVDGGTPRRLTHNRATNTSPCWSPDGKEIVYTSDERGSVQLFVIPAQGGSARRLLTGNAYSSEPDWSPDGQKIAYAARIGGEFQIGEYELSSATATLLSSGGGEDPSWTRNSRHLVFAHGGALYLMDSVTKLIAPLPNGLSRCSEPSVSP